MRKGDLTKVELGERDWKILSALEKWGVLGLAQLDGLAFKGAASAEERAALFFNQSDRRIYTQGCYKRLKDLEGAALVRGHFFLNHPKVYGLADHGHRLLAQAGRAKLMGFRRRISDALLPHELAVNAVGLILEQLYGLPISASQERRIALADGLGRAPARSAISDLWIPGERNPRAIEIELTQKAELRYKELWQAFSQLYPYGTQVLYVAGWPGGVEALSRLTRKLEQFGGWMVYVAGLAAFRETLGACPFINRSSDQIRVVHLVRTSEAQPAVLEVAR